MVKVNSATRGKLGARATAFEWLFEPMGEVNETGRSFLLGQLLGAPAASIMGSCCAIIVVAAAVVRTSQTVFFLLLVLECAMIVWRFVEWRSRTRRTIIFKVHVPTVDASVTQSVLWCTLQGASSFTIMSGDDPVLHVLSATLVMALIGPICARNYAAPRLAFLLILLCDLPFAAGAIASHEPWLGIIPLITPPFLLGATQIIITFHRAMIAALTAEARNLYLAQHDFLTGVLNRQGMDAALSQIVPHNGLEVALLSIDLDGFKLVNDTHGHGAGDLLLIQVADRIQRELSKEFLLGRMGGDEFMIVIQGLSPVKLRTLAEHLITTISNNPYLLDDGILVRIGASIGFACLPEDALTTADLRRCSDEALYAAKNAGKGIGLRYRLSVASPRFSS